MQDTLSELSRQSKFVLVAFVQKCISVIYMCYYFKVEKIIKEIQEKIYLGKLYAKTEKAMHFYDIFSCLKGRILVAKLAIERKSS